MSQWGEDISSRIDGFHRALAELHKKYNADSELFASIRDSYIERVHELLGEQAIAKLLDSSHFVAHYSGQDRGELALNLRLISRVFKDIGSAIESISRSLFALRRGGREQIGRWPEQLRPTLGGVSTGSFVLGVRIGAHTPGTGLDLAKDSSWRRCR